VQLEVWQRTLAASLAGARTGAAGSWPAAALDVHRRNMRGARRQALAGTFPTLEKVVGARYFSGLARDFTCDESNLNIYGREFPSWLECTVVLREELAPFPYLADLARLEWQLHAAYYAPDDPAPDTESFQQAMSAPVAWCLRFSASLSLLKSPWPVATIWRSHRKPAPASEVRPRPCHAVIWRDGAKPRVANSRASHWDLLVAAHSGASIAALADKGMTPDSVSLFLRRGWINGAEPLI